MLLSGGIIGHFTGRLFKQEQQVALNKACGISVLFIAIAGAMQGMLHIDAVLEVRNADKNTFYLPRQYLS